jgi:hypothetical protein
MASARASSPSRSRRTGNGDSAAGPPSYSVQRTPDLTTTTSPPQSRNDCRSRARRPRNASHCRHPPLWATTMAGAMRPRSRSGRGAPVRAETSVSCGRRCCGLFRSSRPFMAIVVWFSNQRSRHRTGSVSWPTIGTRHETGVPQGRAGAARHVDRSSTRVRHVACPDSARTRRGTLVPTVRACRTTLAALNPRRFPTAGSGPA